MYLADTLSRVAMKLPSPSDPQEEVSQCNSEDAHEMFRVELETMELDTSDMYPSTLEEIKAETERILPCQFCVRSWLMEAL